MNGTTTDAFSFAVTEIQTILGGGAPSSHPLAMFGFYKAAVKPLREAYEEAPEDLASAWEFVSSLNMFAALVVAVNQGWEDHPDRQLLSLVELLNELAIASNNGGAAGIKQKIFNYRRDAANLSSEDYLQLTLSIENLGVPKDFINQFEKVVKDLRPKPTPAATPTPNSGVAGGATPITVYHLTDLGNAKRLVANYGRDLRYVYKWGSWLVWDGIRWTHDELGQIAHKAKQTITGIYNDASQVSDPDKRESMVKWALQCESVNHITGMIELAQSEPGIPIRHTELDSDAMLLNCRNGVVDLRTGDLISHRRSDLITKCCDAVYDPAADCPMWLAFLDRIQNKNQTVIDFLKRGVGYSLTGLVDEQVFFFMHGTGRNGKSTFGLAISQILGDYAVKIDNHVLMSKRFQQNSLNDRTPLVGRRFALTSEVEAGQRLSESEVKELTGKDELVARFLYKEQFRFLPSHTIWMYGNYRPIIRGSDPAIWNRILLIPFTQYIPLQERIGKMYEILRLESSGILNWMIQGCLEWQKGGLGKPHEVDDAVAEYKDEMDTIGLYMQDCLIIDADAKTKINDLYNNYTLWCVENGESSLTQRQFSQRLVERGFHREKGTGGIRVLAGLKIAADGDS